MSSWWDDDDIDVSCGCAAIILGLALVTALTLGLWHGLRLLF